MIRKIIHIDMDAFYASVEQRDFPELKGQPLAVGYAGPRGVVAASSYEARKFGVRSAMASVTALKKCPHLLFKPPRFEVYTSVSEEIQKIFFEYTSFVEPLSLDEAYLDVTDYLNQHQISASKLAEEIRQKIFLKTNLTASAGISYNKFLAKLASDQNKPNGQFTIKPSQGEKFIETLKVEKFHGIGPVTAKKMKSLGLHTGADLKKKSLEFLQNHFGKNGLWFFEISRGIDHREVISDRPRKSYGQETTLDVDLLTSEQIIQCAHQLAFNVWQWCFETKNFGRTLTLKIKFNDYKQITRRRTTHHLIDDYDKLQSLILSLITQLEPLPKPVRLVGVSISNFHEMRVLEPSTNDALNTESLDQLNFFDNNFDINLSPTQKLHK